MYKKKNQDNYFKKTPKEYLKLVIRDGKINDNYLMHKFESYIKFNSKTLNSTIYCELFTEFIEFSNYNEYPIKRLVKFSLNRKYTYFFENIKEADLSKRIIFSIIDNINKPRNITSNPSIFLKLIGYTNIVNFNEQEFKQIIDFCLGNLNKYISCDKNILFLLIKLIKKHKNEIDVFKKLIIDDIIKSIQIYFLEFQSYYFRKDYEVIKNFISFIKALNYFKNDSYFNDPQTIVKLELVIEIIIISLFLDSSKEDELFNNFQTKIIINDILKNLSNNNFLTEKQKYKFLQDEEESSFSDYLNCQPKKSMNFDLRSNFFYYCSNFISNLMLFFPKLFYKEKLINFILGSIFEEKSFNSFCGTMDLLVLEIFLKDDSSFNLIDKFSLYKEKNEILDLLSINKIKNNTFNNIILNISKKIRTNSKNVLNLLFIEKQEVIKGYLFKLVTNLFKILPLNIWFPNNLIIKKGMKYEKIIGNLKSFCYLFQFELHSSQGSIFMICNYWNLFKKIFNESTIKVIETQRILRISEFLLIRLFNYFYEQFNQKNYKKEFIYDYLDFYSKYYNFSKSIEYNSHFDSKLLITKLVYNTVKEINYLDDVLISNSLKFFFKGHIYDYLSNKNTLIDMNYFYNLIIFLWKNNDLKSTYHDLIILFNDLLNDFKKLFINDDPKILKIKICILCFIQIKEFLLIFKNIDYLDLEKIIWINSKVNKDDLDFFNRIKTYLNDKEIGYFNKLINIKDNSEYNKLNKDYFISLIDDLSKKINKNKLEKSYIDFYFLLINVKNDKEEIKFIISNIFDIKLTKNFETFSKIYNFLENFKSSSWINDNLKIILLYNINQFNSNILKDNILYNCLIIKMFYIIISSVDINNLEQLIKDESENILDLINFSCYECNNTLDLNIFINNIFLFLLDSKNSKTIWTTINTLNKILDFDKLNIINKTNLFIKIQDIFRNTTNIKTMKCIIQNFLLYDELVFSKENDLLSFFKDILFIDKLISKKNDEKYEITYEKNIQIKSLKRLIFPFIMKFLLKIDYIKYYGIFEIFIEKIDLILEYFSDFSKNFCQIEVIDQTSDIKVTNKKILNYEFNKLSLLNLFEEEVYEFYILKEEFNKNILINIFESFKKWVNFINDNDEISINWIKYEILWSINKFKIHENYIQIKNIFDEDINNIEYD